MRIRRLEPDDAPAYRDLMLSAFASDPDAFLSDFAERETLPLDWWRERLDSSPDAPSLVLGAFAEGEDRGESGRSIENAADIRSDSDPGSGHVASIDPGLATAERLLGIVGAAFDGRVKARHKVGVFGLHVDPVARRRGLARALMTALVEEVLRTRPHSRLLQLTVTEGNEAAITLYRELGFRLYGTEPMAMRSGEGYLAKLHLWRRLDGREG